MTLRFTARGGGRSGFISGIHGQLCIKTPVPQARRQKYMGLLGESEIRGLPGARKVVMEKILIFHSSLTTVQLCDNLISNMHFNVSRFHGRIFTAVDSYFPDADRVQAFNDCTLDSFEIIDQPKKGGLVVSDSTTTEEWDDFWFSAKLVFTQLRWRG